MSTITLPLDTSTAARDRTKRRGVQLQSPQAVDANIVGGKVMSEIDRIMALDAARWIGEKVNDLPDDAKFRAASAIRSLQWADRNFEAGMPIPAAYFALHATEEAVASFIRCVKACGYGNDAKINLKDHQAKSTVSLLAQKISNLLTVYKLAIAVQPESDKLVVKFTVDGTEQYAEASTNLFHFTDGKLGDRKADFLEELVAEFGDIEALKQAVVDGQEARNIILYATNTGLPTGFHDAPASLRRECQLTLGLIWAAIDVVRNHDAPIAFIVQALRTANLVIADMKAKKSGAGSAP